MIRAEVRLIADDDPGFVVLPTHRLLKLPGRPGIGAALGQGVVARVAAKDCFVGWRRVRNRHEGLPSPQPLKGSF
jgi:hypothetical protein